MKERLVGAAVLMAAAVILIPEMLSGPRRPAAPQEIKATDKPGAQQGAGKEGEGNLKRYTIDLQGSAPPVTPPDDGAGTAAEVIEEPAPPPEDVPADTGPNTQSDAQSDAQPVTQESVPAQQPQPEATAPAQVVGAPTPPAAEPVRPDPVPVAPPASQPKPETVADTPAPSQPPPTVTTAKPAASVGGRRWAVQLIAYDTRERAQRMAEDLRSSNYAAFVMPVQSGTGTLYRVRVGPFTAKSDAENALTKLKAVSSGATVVAHP